jgi:hypothetical protein
MEDERIRRRLKALTVWLVVLGVLLVAAIGTATALAVRAVRMQQKTDAAIHDARGKAEIAIVLASGSAPKVSLDSLDSRVDSIQTRVRDLERAPRVEAITLQDVQAALGQGLVLVPASAVYGSLEIDASDVRMPPFCLAGDVAFWDPVFGLTC